jgi:hypothetical protein
MPEAGETQTFTQEEVEARIAEVTAGLKANQAELLRESKAAKAQLKQYEGIDPEVARTALQERQEAERRKEEEKGNWKALEKQLIEKYEGQLKSVYGERDEVRTAMEQYLIDAAAATELASHSDSPKVLLPHVKSVMRVVKDDSGKYHARVIDPETGNVRVGKGQGSTPMTLTELVEEMKQDKEFAPLFRGSGSTGGGASKSSGGAASSQTIAVSHRLSMKDIEALNKGAVAVTQ